MPPTRSTRNRMMRAAALLLLTGAFPTRAATNDHATLGRVVERLVADRCTLCHSGPEAEHGLRLEPGRLYRSVVNAPAAGSRRRLVVPGDAGASLLYRKLLPPADGSYRGARMPYGLEPLTGEEIALVRRWIESFPPEIWGPPVEESPGEAPDPGRTFLDSDLANLPTPDLIGAGKFQFRIAHRFKQDAGDADLDDLFGLDGGAWISLGLARGIGKRWEVGLRHSNFQKEDEAYFKVALLRQAGGKPVSVSYHGSVSHLREQGRQNRTRLGAQVLVSRRLGQRLSVMLAPTLVSHTNYLIKNDTSSTSALGAGAEFRFGRFMAATGEWIGQVGGVKDRYQSVSIGFNVGTPRHGFHLIASNTSGMHTSVYAPGGDLDPSDGDFRLGFNISRIYGPP